MPNRNDIYEARLFPGAGACGRLVHLVLCVVLLASTTAVSSAADKNPGSPPKLEWKAAAARIKITPDSMMWMAGFASRTKPADGVTLDLYAKAVVIQDETGGQLAVITLDLVGIPRMLRVEVAGAVEKAYGIKPAFLLLNASHTHSGPEVRAERTEPTDDQTRRAAEAITYTRQLAGKLVDLVGECRLRLQPARLDYGFARCGFAMNRRAPTPKGYVNRPYPPGPVDLQVPVLRIAGADNQNMAVIFGYACHNTTLPLLQFNGDYAGYAQQAIEAAHPSAVALFVTGCGGDQNPYPRGTLELAQAHGRSLATAVEAALKTDLRELTGAVRAAYEEIPLAYSRIPTRSELETRQKSAVTLEALYARRLLGVLDRNGSLPSAYPYPVQVLRFGDHLTLVALGGEAVVDYSLRLKREIADAHVWVAAYSNDVMTYIPSLRVLREGGYEAGDAIKWGTHPAPWSENVEDHIVGAVHRLRKTLE